MKKKLIPLLLTVAMVASIIGTIPVFATGVPTTGSKLDFTTNTNKSGNGYSWNNTSKTLTLSWFNYDDTNRMSIVLPDGATVKLVGESKITAIADDITNYAIKGLGSLSIKGNGSLNIATLNKPNSNSASFGIRAIGSLTITDAAKVTSTAGEADSKLSSGICVDNVLTITGGATVTATGGNTTEDGTESTGICVHAEAIITGGATVTAISGNTTADGAESVGIYVDKTLTIKDGATVTAASGSTASEGSDSCAIVSIDNLTISDKATVTATAGDTTSNGAETCGIFTSKNLIVKDGATVTTTGGLAQGKVTWSRGIEVGVDLTVDSGATVKAEAGNMTSSDEKSRSCYGIVVFGAATIDNKATLITVGGDMYNNEDGISAGIFVRDPLVIDNGATMIATAGDVDYLSLAADVGSLVVKNKSNLIVVAGNSIENSFGICAFGGTLDLSDPTISFDIRSGEGEISTAVGAEEDIIFNAKNIITPASLRVSDKIIDFISYKIFVTGSESTPITHLKSGKPTAK